VQPLQLLVTLDIISPQAQLLAPNALPLLELFLVPLLQSSAMQDGTILAQLLAHHALSEPQLAQLQLLEQPQLASLDTSYPHQTAILAQEMSLHAHPIQQLLLVILDIP